MGTNDGEEAGDDQAEGQTGALALRAESTLQIRSKDRQGPRWKGGSLLNPTWEGI